MTINYWLQNTIKKLESASVPTAKLDAEVLLADYLDKDRSWIHAHPEFKLPPTSARPDLAEQGRTLQKLDEQVVRRMSHEPLAYIRGYQEFYGRKFIVTNDVLVPRPETESFIEMLLPIIEESANINISSVLDMGTGSGVIAITAKLENPHLNVFATDTSKKALEIAIQNAKELDADIVFKIQKFLDSDKHEYDIILANLPYVPVNMRDISIVKEPKSALFSGKNGLDHYIKLFDQLKLNYTQYIMTESLEIQHESVKKLASDAGYSLLDSHGLVQLFKKKAAKQRSFS